MASTPRLYDCFTFFNENDLLALRMEELDGLVHKHILISSDQTFRGKPKPDYLDYERFQPYIDSGKLRVYNIKKFPRFMDTWGREAYQRDEIEIALERERPEPWDWIMVSDVDEIPSRSAVERINPAHEIQRFQLKKFSYAINMLTDEGNTSAKVFRVNLLRDFTPQVLRTNHPTNAIIEDGGWEFSSLGTPEEIYTKLTSFAHTEFDHMISPEYLAEQIANGKDLLGREIGMRLVEVDETWPVGIVRDRTYWAKHELYLEGDSKCYPLDL